MTARIKTADTVAVISGKDKGTRGKVLRVFPETSKVIVEGVNRVKRHQKPTPRFQSGGIVEKEGTIHVSNVMVVDPETNKPTRLGAKVLETGKKVRISRKSGAVVDK